MAPDDAGPWLNTGELNAAEKGKRAESFFRLIFAAGKLRDAEESGL
jgi:hypothetical protein